MKRIFLFFLVVASFVACDRNRVFESYRGINRKGWNKDSVLTFNFNIEDTVSGHNLYIDLRNKGNYPNSNIWLFLSVSSPYGNSFSDTVEFTLATPSGRWTGSGIGDLFDNQFVYKSNVYFPQKGEYTFTIRHGMREDILKGIRDVGVRVEKIK